MKFAGKKPFIEYYLPTNKKKKKLSLKLFKLARLERIKYKLKKEMKIHRCICIIFITKKNRDKTFYK